MLTISLMFWTDSACFLVHMLADPYVRQHKCPSIRLLTWALDVSPVHCLLKGQRTFSTWYILLFKKSPLLKAHMCNGICFTLYLCRSCRSCIGLKTRESESSWVFGKGTFTSVFPLLVSGSTERNEGQDFDSSWVNYVSSICYRYCCHLFSPNSSRLTKSWSTKSPLLLFLFLYFCLPSEQE